MNEKIISGLIRKRPASPDKSYIFVHDNIAICKAIVTLDYMSLYISRTGDVFLQLDPRHGEHGYGTIGIYVRFVM